MSIENAIKSVITQKLEEGIIERLVAENLEKSINKALESLMGSYGDITKVIEKKIKDVMIPNLETYDYSKYLVKLDCVLTEILKNTSLDNKKILTNFKDLMVDFDFLKVVKLSDIFEKFKQYVERNVDTSEFGINEGGDGVSYKCVTISMEVEYEEERSWSSSSFKYAKVIFECDEDEDLNFEIRLSKFRESPWHLSGERDDSIRTLRRLGDFEIYLLRLSQSHTEIEIDSEYLEYDVEVEATPEASFQ